MTVAVSIVEYNSKELLRECLLGILDQKWNNEVEVWVVDNSSNNTQAAEMILKEFPQVKLIRSGKNRGFAGGQNLALKKIKADFVLLLNPDTKVSKGTIDEMVDFMNKYESCGIASCKLVYPDGSPQPNGGDLPIGFPLISWLFNLEVFGDFPNFHRLDKNYYQHEREVGWVAGTFMMIKKDVLRQVGFFNEQYFMYFEDVEYCFRALKKGFKVMINPGLKVIHISGASHQDPHLAQWRGELKGLLIFYRKHYGLLLTTLVRLLVYISTFLRMIAFGLLGKVAVSKTYGQILFQL